LVVLSLLFLSLNHRLRACNLKADKRRLCADVPPGNAAAKVCLEEQRSDLSSGCRAEIDAAIERRVRDFRLDSRLKAACESDIFDTVRARECADGAPCLLGHSVKDKHITNQPSSYKTYQKPTSKQCAYIGDSGGAADADEGAPDGAVVTCLQDYASELRSDECRALVQRYMALAAEDIRFNAPLAHACAADRDKLCSAVPPGSAQVIRCLQSKREQLSVACRATLFDEEVKFSENIDFQFPMKKACAKELQAYCSKVPHGNARAIRCLQDHKSADGFGAACRAEVERFEASAAHDYRLNFRLARCARRLVMVMPSKL
jgi:Golgi apparatus protein 1